MLDSGKCDNKTWSSCFSLTNSFCSKCWNCLYPCPNKKGSWQQSLSVVYSRDCEIRARTSCLIWLVHSFAGAQFVLSYRFGDGKLNNEIAHETMMSRFTNKNTISDKVRQSKQILQEHCNGCFGLGNFTICFLSNLLLIFCSWKERWHSSLSWSTSCQAT